MLASFRLIAATFLCGFVVVFAGLRMAVSLNDIHEGLPVMAAHAAPVSIAPAADHELRCGMTPAPVMYDLRFAVSRTALAPTLPGPSAPELPAPPLSLLPAEDFSREVIASEPESTVAAIPPDAVAPADAAPAPVEPAKPETPDAATDQPGRQQP